MNLARVGQRVLVVALLAGCASAPPESDRSQTIVITKVAPDVDFGRFKTFFLRPEIRTVDDDGELTPISPGVAEPLLNTTASNLQNRGFTRVTNKDEADLGVELLYTEHVSTTYWCYSWWDPYYWGYPPYWGYYPWYGCDASMWKSNMLSTSMTDLTGAGDSVGDGADGAAGAGGSLGDRVPGIWFSGVYGVGLTTPAAADGIVQAFTQSPYLKAAP